MELWTPTQGEALVCDDPYAVAVQKVSTSGIYITVGHVPQSIFSVFVGRNGTLTCVREP